MEQSTHRNSKSPHRAVLGSTIEFDLDKTLPESEEDRKQAESNYLTTILGIAKKNSVIGTLDERQLKSQRGFKNARSMRPSTRGTFSLKRSNLDFIMGDRNRPYG